MLISSGSKAIAAHELNDSILITIPYLFEVSDYVKLAKRNGVLTTVGLLGPYKAPPDNQEVAFCRRFVAGSLIGSIAKMQKVLDFCARHDILPEVAIINTQAISDAYQKR